jgi:hypothetical protein
MAALASAATLDLKNAVVVAPRGATARETKAVTMLVEEVEKRSEIRWPVQQAAPPGGVPVIAVERGSGPKEGYRVRVEGQRVTVSGNDERGVLFGVGRLLRELRMEKGSVGVPSDFGVTTAPAYPLRGHQLGYRPKTNSYDGWNAALWEQYFRDLAVFGTNAVELLPPRTDDDSDSPHFPLPPMRMMVEMSRLADEYGLDVWIWYPAMDKDYSDPKTVQLALKEWGEVFRQLPRIDAVFVPGGDPGHTQPKYMFPLLEKETEALRRYHPKAQMWMSPQSFNQEWMEEFYGLMAREPAWLAGIVFGPQVRPSLAQLRQRIPKRYPIRHYPDITHSRQCQFPVPDWDQAYAFTEAREAINPRPVDEAAIFRAFAKDTIGFLTYSEGCNDDVNKMIWSALGWNPDAEITEVLREYSRYFIGERYADTFAQGLLALERNWRGRLVANEGVYTTLGQFQAMQSAAAPRDKLNWRFQQALYRAYYDACVRSRLIHETAAEEEATAELRNARQAGSLAAMNKAEAALNRAAAEPPARDWRARVFELAEALFQSIRMQLSVERYQAIDVGRGANLDTIDVPLNNGPWLRQRFAELRKLPEESERLRGIGEILNWENPGPGGFYDDLGNTARQPHLVKGAGFDQDPMFFRTALAGIGSVGGPDAPWRTSWRDHAEALRDEPLVMRYTGLDPAARYKLRVVYAGERGNYEIRLVADDRFEVHPWRRKEFPPRPVEFEIPAQASAGGELTLKWYKTPALGGNGRGTQVAEVWLIRQ